MKLRLNSCPTVEQGEGCAKGRAPVFGGACTPTRSAMQCRFTLSESPADPVEQYYYILYDINFP